MVIRSSHLNDAKSEYLEGVTKPAAHAKSRHAWDLTEMFEILTDLFEILTEMLEISTEIVEILTESFYLVT